MYCKISNIGHIAVVFPQSIEAWCEVENENVIGAVPTGDAPMTSELRSTSSLPTKLHRLLEFLQYMKISLRNPTVNTTKIELWSKFMGHTEYIFELYVFLVEATFAFMFNPVDICVIKARL